MKANPMFAAQPKTFWAMVRTLSQRLGYTLKGPRGEDKQVAVHSVRNMADALNRLGLNPESVVRNGRPTVLGQLLEEYFEYRADLLNRYVQPRLMDAAQARERFEFHFNRLQPSTPIPMNKQKGEKKAHAFFTGLVNMLIDEATGGLPCDFDPRILTTFTRDGVPVRTLARRVDGAFPSAVNPIAIWEIKEYYYTTTFGSRVADGVYETLLDATELEEMEQFENISARHYLFIDSKYTWWDCGRSYLCRLVDMLNMGYVTEVIVGREVEERIPEIASQWAEQFRAAPGNYGPPRPPQPSTLF